MNRVEYYYNKRNQLSLRARNVLNCIHGSAFGIYTLSDEMILNARNCGTKTAREIIEFKSDIITRYPFTHEDREDFEIAMRDDAVIENLESVSKKFRSFIEHHSITTYNKLVESLNGSDSEPYKHLIEDYINLCTDYAKRHVLLCELTTYKKIDDSILNGYFKDLLYYKSNDRYTAKVEKVFRCYSDILSVCLEKENLSPNLYSICSSIRSEFFNRVRYVLNINEERYDLFLNPYISDEEMKFIHEYEDEYKILPVFFVADKLSKRILTSREYNFIRSYYGFSDDKDILEIMEKLRVPQAILTVERAVLRLVDFSLNKSMNISSSQLIEYYPFLTNNFLTEDNTGFERLKVKEHLNYSFNGLCLFSSIISESIIIPNIYITSEGILSCRKSQKQHTTVDGYDFGMFNTFNLPFIFACNKDLLQFDFYYALHQIQKAKLKYNIVIDWKSFCTQDFMWKNGVVKHLLSDVIDLLEYLMRKANIVTDESDFTIVKVSWNNNYPIYKIHKSPVKPQLHSTTTRQRDDIDG